MSAKVIALPWTRNGLHWRIACINWGIEGAPHALLYATRDGEMVAEFYAETWDAAITHLDRLYERGVA